MKCESLTVEVNAKLNVDKETAECALKLVETYVNNNAVYVEASREETGIVKYRFVERYGNEE